MTIGNAVNAVEDSHQELPRKQTTTISQSIGYVKEDDIPQISPSTATTIDVELSPTPLTNVDEKMIDSDLRQIDHEPAMNISHKQSGFFGTSFNFINSILGVGIVGIPFALREAGLITGLILLIVMAFVTDWSIGLLIKTSHLCGAQSYPDLCQKAFGVTGKIFSAFFMWFLTFFGGIGYTIIVGDTVPAVMEAILGFPDLSVSNWFYKLLVSRTFWILATIILIMLPLSLLDNVSKLESFSFLSIVAEVILLGVVLAEAIIILVRVSSGKANENDVKGWPQGSQILIHRNVFGAIGVFSMAYITHHNSHMLYDAMKDATPARFRRATHVSVLFSAFIMCFIGLIGYLSFQNNTMGNILNNIDIRSVQGNIARAAIAVTMFFTVPLEMFVCRNAVADILTSTIFRNMSLPVIAGRFQVKRIHLIRILVIIMMSVITLVAILVRNLGNILELTGGFSAVMLAYVLPSICHLKIAEGKLLSKEKAPALLLCVVGLFCFVSGTSFNLYNIITKYQKGEA